MGGRLGKKITLNISELNIVKEKVVKYPGTIEDYLMEKGFTEVHYRESNTPFACSLRQCTKLFIQLILHCIECLRSVSSH